MAVFEGKKSSNDIINSGTMSDDEVVASDVPPRYLLPGITQKASFFWNAMTFKDLLGASEQSIFQASMGPNKREKPP